MILSILGQEFDSNISDLINQEKLYLEMKKTKDCYDLYLKCDILLLTDVFEKFRINSVRIFGLCLSHYQSVPALSQDAMLNMTKVQLELVLEPEMFILFEKSIRRGVSYTFNR